MDNPFILSDKGLTTLLNSYNEWREDNQGAQSHVKELKSRSELLHENLLDEEFLEEASENQFQNAVMDYFETLEGPAQLFRDSARSASEDIRGNLKYLVGSDDSSFEKASSILEGERKIKYLSKAFWTPLSLAQYPETLPRWNKTADFMENVGVDIKTTKDSIEENYRKLSEAFEYLTEIDTSQDFHTLDHLMHYGISVDEGRKLLEDLLGETKGETTYWLEKTTVSGRPDRKEGEVALGKAIWSPQEDRAGRDIYSSMREVKEGDIVYHLVDREKFVGKSVVDEECDDDFYCLEGTEWDREDDGKTPGYLMAIAEAAEIALQRIGKPASPKEVHREITKDGLYRFGAEDPVDVIRLQMDRHASNVDRKDSADPELFFRRDDGTYSLLPEAEIGLKDALETSLDYSVFESLYFPEEQREELLQDVEAALNSGKHIIFTGPPGTGKTAVAENVARSLAEEDENVTGYQMTTATSDWSTFDTVGGYMPSGGSDGGAGVQRWPLPATIPRARKGPERVAHNRRDQQGRHRQSVRSTSDCPFWSKGPATVQR